MQAKSLSFTAKIAAAAVALALGAGQTLAAPATTATPGSEQQVVAPHSGHYGMRDGRGMHGKHHRQMRDVGLWVPGYGPLKSSFVETLNLTDKQKALIADAKSAGEAARTAHRDAMSDVHKARAEQLKSGKLDPKSALAQQRDMHEKAQAERAEQDKKWLAVWDALDATQHEKIAKQLADRTEKFAQRAAERHQKHAAEAGQQGATQAAPKAGASAS
ncbi:hypothetical protein GSY71_03685 [Pusillimonas sp. TS35]|nr:hypothetical protein [Pusillimonas sp. TS35]